MKRAWHQLPPAVSVQQVVDRAVAGDMPDRFLVGRLEIMNVQHLAGAGRFGKTREQGLFFEQRHVLVVASAIRLGLERLDAAVVISHVRAVHRTQRHAHCSRNRRLRHPTLTQQHHLDALARCGRYLPPQRSFQPSHLGFAAFDHLFPPESDGPSESQLGDEKQLAKQSLPLKKLDSSRYRGGIRYKQQIARLKNRVELADERLGDAKEKIVKAEEEKTALRTTAKELIAQIEKLKKRKAQLPRELQSIVDRLATSSATASNQVSKLSEAQEAVAAAVSKHRDESHEGRAGH